MGFSLPGFLKLLVPVIVVLPGITMFVLHKNGMFQHEMMSDGVIKPDHAYPTLMNLLPPGLKGVAFAALTAAVVASLAGKANSISTIFSLDIYKKFFNKEATEKQLVGIGKWVVILAMGIAALIAPTLKTWIRLISLSRNMWDLFHPAYWQYSCSDFSGNGQQPPRH